MKEKDGGIIMNELAIQFYLYYKHALILMIKSIIQMLIMYDMKAR